MWGGKKKRKEQWGSISSSYSGSSGVSQSDINTCIAQIKAVSTFGINDVTYSNGTMIVYLLHSLTDTQYWNIEKICDTYGFDCEYR